MKRRSREYFRWKNWLKDSQRLWKPIELPIPKLEPGYLFYQNRQMGKMEALRKHLEEMVGKMPPSKILIVGSSDSIGSLSRHFAEKGLTGLEFRTLPPVEPIPIHKLEALKDMVAIINKDRDAMFRSMGIKQEFEGITPRRFDPVGDVDLRFNHFYEPGFLYSEQRFPLHTYFGAEFHPLDECLNRHEMRYKRKVRNRIAAFISLEQMFLYHQGSTRYPSEYLNKGLL